MTQGLILFGFVFALVVTYLAVTRRHQSKYFAIAEYWVYLPGVKMPPQDDIMSVMIANNPYSRRGMSPVGPAEGLLYSDIRLHIALVLREKNAYLFRPDLFEDYIEPTQEILEALSAAQSLVKLRYASDIPLKDKRHLQFLLHAADAVAGLGEGVAIFDVKADRIMTRTELQGILKENFDATGPDLHTNIFWKRAINSGSAETRGLKKIGLADLRTGDMEPDQRVLATNLLSETVRSLWESGTMPETLEVSNFGDTFRMSFETGKDEIMLVRIMRVQAV